MFEGNFSMALRYIIDNVNEKIIATKEFRW
jgi:hypothetical protein